MGMNLFARSHSWRHALAIDRWLCRREFWHGWTLCGMWRAHHEKRKRVRNHRPDDDCPGTREWPSVRWHEIGSFGRDDPV